MTFFFSRNSFLIHLFVYRDKTDTLYLLAFDRIFIIIITNLYQLLLWEIIEKNQFWKNFQKFFLREKGKSIDRILIILKFMRCKYLNVYRPVRFFSKLTFASGPYVINAPIIIIRTIWMKNSWYTCCFPLEKNIPWKWKKEEGNE